MSPRTSLRMPSRCSPVRPPATTGEATIRQLESMQVESMQVESTQRPLVCRSSEKPARDRSDVFAFLPCAAFPPSRIRRNQHGVLASHRAPPPRRPASSALLHRLVDRNRTGRRARCVPRGRKAAEDTAHERSHRRRHRPGCRNRRGGLPIPPDGARALLDRSANGGRGARRLQDPSEAKTSRSAPNRCLQAGRHEGRIFRPCTLAMLTKDDT